MTSWLIEYWIGKYISGLTLIPLSRHCIMYVEVANRIIAKIKKAMLREKHKVQDSMQEY